MAPGSFCDNRKPFLGQYDERVEIRGYVFTNLVMLWQGTNPTTSQWDTIHPMFRTCESSCAQPHRIARAALLATGLWVLGPLSAWAEDAERPVLQVPWAGGAGFGFVESDGTPRSFYVDLARMIGAEAGFDIDLVEYSSVPAAVTSIQKGETDLLAGAAAEAFDLQEVLVLGPVAETQTLIFSRNSAEPDPVITDFVGKRIGVVRNTATSRITVPEGVEVVEYEDLVTAFAKLLHLEVDGVLALSSQATRTLSRSGLEVFIRPSSVPVQNVSSFVILRREHEHLRPSIEAALSKFEQNGDLRDLKNTWSMIPPPPLPEVLSVGVAHFPPYYVVDEEGGVSGFAIEVIQELAERAGLKLTFEVVSLESWSKGPRVGAFDILPVRSVTPNESELLDFTAPVQTIDYVPFVRAADAGKPLVPEKGRIGILFSTPVRDEISQRLGVDLVPLQTPETAIKALETGAIDVLFYPYSAFETFLALHGGSDRFARLSEPVFRNDLAIAIRPGLGDLDKRFNVVIQGFLGSGQYRALASKWFDPPPFWTPDRIRIAEVTAAGVLIGSILLVFGLVVYGRSRALRHAEAMEGLTNRIQSLLDTSQSAILGFNRAGEIISANAGAQAMIPGLGVDDAMPWPANMTFLAPDTQTPLGKESHPILRALAGQSLRGEVALLRRASDTETPHYIRVSSSPVPPAEAGDVATVVIIDDVNDLYESRLHAEEQVRIAAVAQKQESIGKLTGGIAHDFNNLLAVILGNLEFLHDEDPDPERKKFAKAAIEATLRGSGLVRSMLAFARRSQIEPQVLDLNSVVRSLEELSLRTMPASIRIQTSLRTDLWRIRADRSLTESAILNLVLNAKDAMNGTGRLTIETTNVHVHEDYLPETDEGIPPGEYAMLAVSDTGHGIAPSQLSQIFEPFFTTKGPQGGSGLGLSMVQGFMKQTGGTVRVYSELGVGTTVKLYFPVFRESVAPIDGAQSLAELATGEGERILLVEDQPDVLSALKRALERGGYTVVAAECGDKAFEVFEADPDFDLVVTDIVMPGRLQGPTLVRALREIRPELRAVFMSGYADEATVHGNGLRPNDIRLMKPVQRAEFFSAVKRALTDKES